MAIARHSHCYSKCQLEIIIDGYLNMAPYYSALLKVLKNYSRNYEQQPDMHRSDKSHPIRIYAKDFTCNKNLLEQEKQQVVDNRNELRSTFASNTLKYYYLYPLQCVIEMLQSEQFYRLLPQNIIINGLFTETNLKIIIETLKIVSEDMSKRIRSTISGKQLEKIDEDRIIEEDRDVHSQLKINMQAVTVNYISSIINIDIQEEEEALALKLPTMLHHESRLVRTNIVGTQRQINIDREVAEKECRFCQGYLIYLYETVGQCPTDEDVNRISVQSVRCLRLIAKAVTHFTMYLTETGQTHIKNDVHLINKILNTMGLVITEDIYSSELNPKNKQPNPITNRQPKNLLEELQPYFDSKAGHKEWENYYSMQELFRMIIYCPTTDEVKEQLKQYQVDHFEKDPVLKSYEKEEIIKKLLKKECHQMKQFQAERVTIAENTVNIRPVYKQLQFQDEHTPQPNLQPTHYNVYNPTRSNTCKQSPNDKYQSAPFANSSNNSKVQPKPAASPKEQTKNFMAELTNCISKIYQEPKKPHKKSRGKKSRENLKQSKTVDWNLDSNVSAINKTLKRNLLKQSNTASKFITASSDNIDFLPERGNSQLKQDEDNGLSDTQFRKMLYNAYNRNQMMQRAQINVIHPHTTNPSINNYINASTAKLITKKNNGYSSTLSQFIGRKQEQEQIECIQKQEKEIYNKQLLNGFYIKSEIEQELKLGKAVVYNDYRSIKFAKENEILDFSSKTYQHQAKLSENTTNRLKLPKQNKPKQNLINQTSTRYNQTGLIRNQKYNKSIKNQLINHRPSFLILNEKENEAKNRLAQTFMKKKQSQTENTSDIRVMYQRELKAAKDRKLAEQANFISYKQMLSLDSDR